MPHDPARVYGGKIENRQLRAQEALKLRAKGYTFERVAGEMGISETTARGLVKEGLTRLREENLVTAEDMRQQIQARLEWAADAISSKVQAGDVYAIEKWVMIQREIAKLYGVYTPVPKDDKLEVTIKGLPAGPGTVGERIAGLIAKQQERQLEAPGDSIVTTVDAVSVRELDPQ